MSHPHREHQLSKALLYVLFFCSGAASLACEVVWFKQLGLVLGSSTYAASVVVACFFGGLSLGSALLGPLADRAARPLRMYGALELSLSLVSLWTTLLLASWQSWVSPFLPWMSLEAASALPIKVALALPALVPPTILMGATLPVLTRHLVRSRSELAANVGALYALNTLGASFGCAAVGWVTISAWGVSRSAMAASLVYACIGAAALWMSRRADPLGNIEEKSSSKQTFPPFVLIGLFAASASMFT